MDEERYPGERQGLRRFLEQLVAVIEPAPGAGCLLLHGARRALRSGRLADLRHARRLYDNLPPARKSRLAARIVAGPGAVGQQDLLEAYSRRAPLPFVCFETPSVTSGAEPASVAIRHELLEASPMRVMVEPGTLPSTAARLLRLIATMIEQDRRLLSHRFWTTTPGAAGNDADSADCG
jgi:hypothetical protein